jgi:hypothetical protein
MAAAGRSVQVSLGSAIVKFYLAAAICILALYGLWLGMGEWIGAFSSKSPPLNAGTAMILSLLGMGLGRMLGRQAVIEELSVRCD